ncbi:MAG TPA: polysaccharide biosynthesis/export family protein [Gemmatimonadales bacterium]|nr:polysaccharide biosynthesis/export family protein [Gemmatimonadales bacterium]
MLACLSIAACTPTAQNSSLNAAASANSPSPAYTSARSEDVYRLVKGDILEVHVFRQPDLSRTVDVDGAGQILLPLIGAMPAAGRTVRELETEITRLLRAKYLQSPQVSVAVRDAVGQRVTVEGAVRNPGVRNARGQTTLLRVLAESGGFAETADQSGVMVFRQTEQGRTVMRHDANAIRVGQAPDPVIMGGDTIVVDDSSGKTAWKHFREVLGVASGGVGLARVF